MRDSNKVYLASQLLGERAPPSSEVGVGAWLEKNLFSNLLQSVLTALGVLLVFTVAFGLLSFVWFDATFFGTTRADCLPNKGACWPYVEEYFHQFIYGTYPIDQRWRPDAVLLAGFVTIFYALGSKVVRRLVSIAAIGILVFLETRAEGTLFLFGTGVFTVCLFEVAYYAKKVSIVNAVTFIGYPVFAFILLTGGNFDLNGFGFSFLEAGSLRFWVEFILLAVITTAVPSGIVKASGGNPRIMMTFFGVFWLGLAIVCLAASYDFGMTEISTDFWGGLLVTLVIAVSGIVLSLPIGILLALGRRSNMPVIKLFCVCFIELWRGVPLITILFMADVMFPLFLPSDVSVDGLIRVLVGITMFASAYMAEVVRGGLQAISKGQYEGAAAVGLSYSQTTRMIILPQALKLVIPSIVNTFIGLFKDTTLVSIVGLFDLLGIVQLSFADPSWAVPTQSHTGYLVAAVIFFIFCFGMSRYSIHMERKLDTGHRH